MGEAYMIFQACLKSKKARNAHKNQKETNGILEKGDRLKKKMG